MIEDNDAVCSENSIKPIDRRSVHQICSGQVILSLATAVKELVENSIDAGATNIEIKLKEFGIESIEVQDNGSGIEEKDFEALALKHYTSKLKDFADLTVIETFGFRGEALSSLCALSKVTITTHHESKEFGSRLEFDYNGKLTSNTPCAREIGTTVIVNQLFHTLPVRHKEFQRNIRKEFPKLNSVLQAYGIISTGVRITCSNYTEKNKKTVLLSSGGSEKPMENIASIFGPKQVQSLLTFKQTSPTEDILESFGVSTKSASENMEMFSIHGYISKIVHGCGRSSLDRQFYFINKRPCDIMKISRLVNEVYHMFNRNQNPFVFLDINLKTDTVDVNITPDKRQVFFQNEKLLLATLKSSLLKMFSDSAGRYEIGIPSKKKSSNNDTCQEYSGSPKLTFDDSLEHSPTNLSSSSCNEEEDAPMKERGTGSSLHISNENRPDVSSLLSKFKSRFSNDNGAKSNEEIKTKGQTKINQFAFTLPKATSSQSFHESSNKESSAILLANEEALRPSETVYNDNDISNPFETNNTNCISISKGRDSNAHISPSKDAYKTWNGVLEIESNRTGKIFDDQTEKPNVDLNELGVVASYDSSPKAESLTESCNEMKNIDVHSHFQSNGKKGSRSQKIEEEVAPIERSSFVANDLVPMSSVLLNDNEAVGEYERPFKKCRVARRTVEILFDVNKLKNDLSVEKCKANSHESGNLLGFHAKITPQQNNVAEEELRKNISKDSFRTMEIVGQFNLGFIIARLQEDLFIIDQHASDEKYNFETLQKDHYLKGQRLIQPRPLELTPMNESILLENVEIFQKNGFDFMVDLEQPAGKKVKLVSLPTSKNWTFDVEDIDELIFMLSDNPGMMCRPSRVRSMFASRACRMSTMVGSALNYSQMKTLVNHMAEIEHPWNCPHGRPTMRHLISLERINPSASKTVPEE